MSEIVDVPHVIQLLVKLQGVARDGFILEQDKESLTKKLARETDKYDKLKEEVDLLNSKNDKYKKENDEWQNEIGLHIEEIKKIKDKEKFVKTQKEYIALDTEQSIKRDRIAELEKQIKSNNKEMETVNKENEGKLKKLNAQETKLTDLRDNTEIKIIDIEDQLKSIEEVREEVIPELDPQVFSHYDRIVKNKNGLGIVPVEEGICEGCNIAVTPHLKGELRKAETLITCPNCARILYLP